MRGPVVENIHITDSISTQCNQGPLNEQGAITIDTSRSSTTAEDAPPDQ